MKITRIYVHIFLSHYLFHISTQSLSPYEAERCGSINELEYNQDRFMILRAVNFQVNETKKIEMMREHY